MWYEITDMTQHFLLTNIDHLPAIEFSAQATYKHQTYDTDGRVMSGVVDLPKAAVGKV
jgi:hypothetical protein